MVESSLWGVILGEQCNSSGEEVWGWVVYPLVMLYAFYILAKICDGHLTLALDFIVDRLEMSQDVAGATFLAMASSAPELFTSIIATFVVVSPTGAGNIVGSAVFNLLVIIGVMPVFAGVPLKIWWYPTARDAVFYSVSIAELGLVLMDGQVYWWEGLIMLLSYVIYVCYFMLNETICNKFGLRPPGAEDPDDAAERGGARTPEQEARVPAVATPEDPSKKDGEVQPGSEAKLRRGDTGGSSSDPREKEKDKDEESVESRTKTPSHSFSLRGAPQKAELKMSKVVPYPEENPAPKLNNEAKAPEPEVTGQEEVKEGSVEDEEKDDEEEGWCKYEPVMAMVDLTMPDTKDKLYSLFGLCCIWIGIFTYFAVDTGGRLGKCLLEIPDVVMGLIVFAAGTSVPDAMGSIAVAKEGMGDMAVANAVGSNTFDILLGLGFPWFLKAAITGEPITIPRELLTEAILILAGCLVFYLVVLNINRWVLTKGLGMILLFLYLCVIVFILVWYEVQVQR